MSEVQRLRSEVRLFYFFSSAIQFVTSVNGSDPCFVLPLLIKNLFPSFATTNDPTWRCTPFA